MKAPVSWIREYAALPADLATATLTARLTLLGLKLEALHRAGDQISGPLVVGRVLTMEPEPQKNGKTINWCTVDVGDANGTGEPQGIVCGAHNFAAGDLVVVVLPGGVLPGGFEISARKTYGHVSAGMICSSRELGTGDDHDGIIVLPADAGQPGDDAFAVLGLDEEVIEFEINPDRAYALSLRGVAREAALGFDVPFTDPADRPEPVSDELAHRVEVADDTRCDVFSGRSVSGFDPSAPTPAWLARRIQQCGMRPISLAVDVTNYVMLELGQPIHGFDRDKLSGPIRVRLAEEGERLRTLDGVDRTLTRRGRPHHRRLRADRARGRHGRRDDRAVRDDHRHLHRGRPLGPGPDLPHRQAAQAAVRGRQAVRARHRPDRDAPGGRPGRRAAGAVRRRHRRAGRHARRRGAAPQPTITIDDDLPARITGLEIASGDGRGDPGRDRLRRRPRRQSADRDPAAVAPRPHRPLRPGRGGRAGRRLRPGPVRAARPRPPAAA